MLLGVGTDLVPALTRPAIVRALSALQAVCLASLLFGGERLPLPLAVGAFVVAGIAGCAWQGAHFTHIAPFAGPRSAGAALGFNYAATSLGAFIPQVLVGAMLATDWTTPLLLLGVAPALLAIWAFPSGRAAARPMDQRALSAIQLPIM